MIRNSPTLSANTNWYSGSPHNNLEVFPIPNLQTGRDTPAFYKVTFTSVAIDSVTQPGGRYDESEIQETVEELDTEVKSLPNTFVLGKDGLREKGTIKQRKFCPTADYFKAMTLLMAKKKKSEPIVKAETAFEVTTVAELESTAEKPVVKFSVAEVEPAAVEEKRMVVESVQL
ncbi:hypothetical protein FPQ18DRAFT_305612 [Pyronema domesticum]|nr:hypothetical protein FPQ18DRAFT_305612 [Pyronema domesticum]